MPTLDVLDASWAIMVDGYNGMIDPQKVRVELERAFGEAWPDRETWGVDVSAVTTAEQGNMEAAQATRLTDEERERLRRERDERRAQTSTLGS